jgi:hypothetical protein
LPDWDGIASLSRNGDHRRVTRAPELTMASTLPHLPPAMRFKDRNHMVNLLRHISFSDRAVTQGLVAKQVRAMPRRIDRR